MTLHPAPLVIAHRGASGYLPEHTLVAKALAYGQGADYLEQDLVATRDGVPLVCHDLTLDALTDVARRFPGRARADGRHYVIDFTLAELRTLAVTERRGPDGRPAFPGRFPADAGAFGLVTLDEELRFVAGLNRATGRRVGVYPEIKRPAWHRAEGIDLTAAVLAVLEAHGCLDREAPVYLQCFDAAELVAIRSRLGAAGPRLVQLVGPAAAAPLGDLVRVAGYADALGCEIGQLWSSGRDTGIASAARAAGLDLHAYTVRADALPTGIPKLAALLEVLVGELGVAGLFTDFPDRVRAWIDGR